MLTQLRISGADRFETDYPLVARGAIDSIELMEIILFLEESFRMTIDDTEILPENLGTLAAIEMLARRKTEAQLQDPPA
jgi:acyl carrier protein